MPEKRPRTREIPRKLLKSLEKPDDKSQLKPEVGKAESREEVKSPSNLKEVSPKTSLSLRKDVVYKTLIRSVKRYLTER